MEGKGWEDRKGPFPQKILLTPSFLAACVTEVAFWVPHCPPLSLPVSRGGGVVGVVWWCDVQLLGRPGGRRRKKRDRALDPKRSTWKDL